MGAKKCNLNKKWVQKGASWNKKWVQKGAKLMKIRVFLLKIWYN